MNIFDKASITIRPFLEMTGYEPKTTFWSDFTIAETVSGADGIKDTYNRAFNARWGDYVYLTELVMMLNWKIWYHHDTGNMELAGLYNDLWEQTDKWALENLKGEEKDYFIRTLD